MHSFQIVKDQGLPLNEGKGGKEKALWSNLFFSFLMLRKPLFSCLDFIWRRKVVLFLTTRFFSIVLLKTVTSNHFEKSTIILVWKIEWWWISLFFSLVRTPWPSYSIPTFFLFLFFHLFTYTADSPLVLSYSWALGFSLFLHIPQLLFSRPNWSQDLGFVWTLDKYKTNFLQI